MHEMHKRKKRTRKSVKKFGVLKRDHIKIAETRLRMQKMKEVR